MFLKTNILILIALVAVSAQANRISSIEAGNYVLDAATSTLDDRQKREGVCSDFSLSKADAAGKNSIFLGAKYSFWTRKSRHLVDSDINPGVCTFVEENNREDDAENETRLTRINEEICIDDGKEKWLVRKRDVATAIFTPKKIELRYEQLGAKSFTCIWNLRTTTPSP